MSQNIITHAFETFRAQCELTGQPVVLDEILLAHIPDLDPDAPVDRNTIECKPEWIVHRQAPTQKNALNHNAVAYGLVLDTRLGDFRFNAMFLTHKASGTIAMAVYKGIEAKLATTDSQTGNSLVKTLVMQYEGAAGATQLQVDAGTWMVDYQARFAGLMQDTANLGQDIYGTTAFLGDGFAVTQAGDGWQCAPGKAYVKGIRINSQTAFTITGTGPQLVLDVWQQGTATGQWQSAFALMQTDKMPDSHTDKTGTMHHYALIARYQQDKWQDARSKGGMEQHLLTNDPHGQYIRKDSISASLTLDSQAHVASAKAVAALKKRVDYSVALGQGAVTDMGQWDASKGTYPAKPYVTDDTGKGQTISGFWLVTKGGTVQGVEYGVGDKLNYTKNEDTFFKTDNTESVTSVNGRKGAVNLALNDFNGIAGNTAKLEGRTKAEVVAEARNNLSVNGHSHDDRYYTKGTSDGRFQPKGSYAADNHHHDGRYLGKFARANDAAKLEGYTKAQVVAEARQGLHTYSETHLWSNLAGQNSGTVVLSRPYTEFDALLIISAPDNRSVMLSHYVPQASLTMAKSKNMPVGLIAEANAIWNAKIGTDNRTLTPTYENSVLFAIYGVKF